MLGDWDTYKIGGIEIEIISTLKENITISFKGLQFDEALKKLTNWPW